jgi:hypothetical protein
MPGPAAWTVLASGSRSSCCDRPARFRGGAAGLGEVAGRCVLILVGERISAISGFTDNSVLARFRLPCTSPNSLGASFKTGPVPAVAPALADGWSY